MPPKSKRQESTSAEDDVNLKSIDSKLDLILNQLSDMNQRLNKLETNQQQLEVSMEFYHSENEELKKKQSQLEKFIETAKQKLDDYKHLDARVEAAENAARSKCIELNGIPYKKDEDLTEALKKILNHQKIDTIKPVSDIDTIYRIRQSKRIIIKFLHTNKRDFFFQNYRKNIMSTTDLGFLETSKIFINEVLSAKQSTLFWQARSFKKDYNYRFIWTFNQKIYLRKDANSDAIIINSIEDLEKLKN